MNRSLRWQLLVRIAATTIAVFSVTAVATFVLVRNSLRSEFDSLLDAKVHALARLVEQDHDRLRIEFAEHALHEFVRNRKPEYYEVWDEKGVAISRSPHLGSLDLLSSPRVGRETVFASSQLPDGRLGRIAAVQFVPIVDDVVLLAKGGKAPRTSDAGDQTQGKPLYLQKMTLAIGRGTEEIEQTIERLAGTIFVASTAALALLLCALAWTVSRALRPVQRLASQIASVDANSLATRLDIEGVPSEIVPVVSRVNRLMKRLEEAFAQERTLTADIAHELRTPLAGLRSTMQVALSRRRGQAEYRDAIGECEAICDQMQRLVETLLSLARLEYDQSRDGWCRFEVSKFLEACWKPFDEVARARQIRISLSGPTGVFLRSDPDKMRIIVSNLFDNAVSHADEMGDVCITWQVGSVGVELQIANTGCSLDAEQVRHVFDRFWRGDGSRSGTGTHAGLGLALSQKLVESLGGSIAASCTKGVFRLNLIFCSETIQSQDSDVTSESSALANVPLTA